MAPRDDAGFARLHQLIDALRCQDAAAAERVMAAHIAHAGQTMLAWQATLQERILHDDSGVSVESGMADPCEKGVPSHPSA